MVKTLETVYNGYHFRSRLEARWAVFFDEMDIEYLYEPKAFELSNGDKYLPDFYLPQYDMWAEVKPTHLKGADYNKAVYLVKDTEQSLVVLAGDPDCKTYCLMKPAEKNIYTTADLNFIKNGKNNLTLNEYLNKKDTFLKKGEEGLRAVNAVKKARAERFGVYESEYKESLF